MEFELGHDLGYEVSGSNLEKRYILAKDGFIAT